MKCLPIVLRLVSGSETPASAFRGVDVHERDVVVIAEETDDLVRLAEPHQAMIDEHASELVADRLMDQDSCDGAVDTA